MIIYYIVGILTCTHGIGAILEIKKHCIDYVITDKWPHKYIRAADDISNITRNLPY